MFHNKESETDAFLRISQNLLTVSLINASAITCALLISDSTFSCIMVKNSDFYCSNLQKKWSILSKTDIIKIIMFRAQPEWSITLLYWSSGTPYLEKQLCVSTDINIEPCSVVLWGKAQVLSKMTRCKNIQGYVFGLMRLDWWKCS